ATLKRPRKHYQWYYSTRQADADMRECAQGLPAFLRAYYHVKSADWAGNTPYRLAGWSAQDLAQMPTYYIMDLDQDMAQTVAPYMPDAAAVAGCGWLTDAELAVYAEAFARTGFQGGLQWYRARTTGLNNEDCLLYSGARIRVPSVFISGASDWGVYQRPGDVEQMQSQACTQMTGCHLVPGAGHWVQQEQPSQTARLLLEFLASRG
ncbi:MAG: alpha/beta hydrolase, partial [Quisquiliibacterium sp.]